MRDQTETGENKPRKKGLTDVTLGWLADRLRRAAKLKEEIDSGHYKVESERIAASILNIDEDNKSEP